MGFLQHQQDVHFSLSTRVQFPTLLKESGSFSFLQIIMFFYYYLKRKKKTTLINHVICLHNSSRIASRSIALTESESLSDDIHGDASRSIHGQPSASQLSSSPSPIVSISPLSRFKHKITSLWLHTVQRWPVVCHFPIYTYNYIYALKK